MGRDFEGADLSFYSIEIVSESTSTKILVPNIFRYLDEVPRGLLARVNFLLELFTFEKLSL